MGLTAEEEAIAWARCGAAALTGRADVPALGPPRGLMAGLSEVGNAIAAWTAALGRPVVLDGGSVVAERATLVGLTRAGAVSCGGATRMVRAADGELVALSLPRPDDWALLPALFELPDQVAKGEWDRVSALVAEMPSSELIGRGAGLLGLAVARLGEASGRLGTQDDGSRSWFPSPTAGAGGGEVAGLLVVDLSGLWAGPLAASVLADAGARVVKVESTARPDGARSGPPAVFDLLNAGKESVALDLAEPGGRAALGHLVARADVVVSSARARALRQLGLDPSAVGERGQPSVWLSVTGHGLAVDRIAFGDDAAVAGGLVVSDDGGPCFCADAVADPLAGLVGAAAMLSAVGSSRPQLIDLSMSAVAARFAGPTLPLPDDVELRPGAVRVRGIARPLGVDTNRVLDELGIA